MTDPHPPGATLHLGGTAWAHPDLEDTLTSVNPHETHNPSCPGYGNPTAPPCTCDGVRLTPYPGNPRRGDQDAITASIRDLGLYRTIIAQRTTGHVLAGNHTLRALQALGAERVPVTWVDVDDTRAAAIVARDNLTSTLGADDPADLLALLADDTEVLALSGYATDDLTVLQRAVDNLAFVEAALAGAGEPESDPSGPGDPIDVDGDTERVTVTVDAGRKRDLYALLAAQDYVRDVADTHTRKAST